MNIMNKKIPFLFAIIILTAALLSVVAIIYYRCSKNLEESPLLLSTQQLSGQKDETADWKTYTNTDYGFEMKYPNDWSPIEIEKRLYQFQTPDGKIGFPVTKTDYTGSLDEYFESQKEKLENAENAHFILSEKKEIFVGGQRAIEIPNRMGDKYEELVILVKDYNSIYTIFLTQKMTEGFADYASIDTKKTEILGKMLSTLVFTAQKPAETAGIVYFYGQDCPACEEVEKFMQAHNIAQKINITKYDISITENNNLLKQKANECGAMNGIPLIWDKGECYVGNDAINYLSQYITIQPLTTVNPSIQPQIAIISPNGSETWLPGLSYDITWETIGIISNADISIQLSYILAGKSLPYESSIFPTGTTDVKNTGFYRWFIPADNFSFYTPWYKIQSNKYRIRIIYSNPKTGRVIAEDYSDNYFNIIPKSVVIISPNGGEVWRVGETHDITWETLNIPPSSGVQISLYDMQGKTSSTLIANTANSGSYLWTIPNKLQDITPLGGRRVFQKELFITDSITGRTYYGVSDNYFTINTR